MAAVVVADRTAAEAIANRIVCLDFSDQLPGPLHLFRSGPFFSPFAPNFPESAFLV